MTHNPLRAHSWTWLVPYAGRVIMAQAPTSIKPTGDLAVNLSSFGLHLKAENVSPRTRETYTESVAQLARFLMTQGMPQYVANIHREHVEAFIAHLLEKWKPATASNRRQWTQVLPGAKGLQGDRLLRWQEQVHAMPRTRRADKANSRSHRIARRLDGPGPGQDSPGR